MKNKNPPKKTNLEQRNKEIYRLFEEGLHTYKEIGQMYGISRQRVYQLLRRQGVNTYERVNRMHNETKKKLGQITPQQILDDLEKYGPMVTSRKYRVSYFSLLCHIQRGFVVQTDIYNAAQTSAENPPSGN